MCLVSAKADVSNLSLSICHNVKIAMDTVSCCLYKESKARCLTLFREMENQGKKVDIEGTQVFNCGCINSYGCGH